MEEFVLGNVEYELKEAEKMESMKDDEEMKTQKYTLGGGALSLICCGCIKNA